MSRTRPIIGIAATTAPIRFQKYNVDAAFCPTTYIDAVAAAGGIPVLVPPMGAEPDPQVLAAVLDRLDGYVVAGGDDVDPSLFGGLRKPATTDFQLRRDLAEAAAVRMAIERDLPLLGVCRGMQMLNVATGGTLVDDIVPGSPHVPHQTPEGGFTTHVVVSAEKSLARRVIGNETAEVPTLHHQAVDVLGSGLHASAWAEDGVVEAIEAYGRTFVLGVQWHPERDSSSPVFRAFVDAVIAAKG